MDLGVAGAAAAISGGSKGMGRAAAEFLAGDGCRIGVIARDLEVAEQTAAHLKELGSPDAFAVRADVGVPADVDNAFREIGDRWGELNILVNAPGPRGGGSFEELTDEDWLDAINLGLLGMVRCIRAALPLMRAAEWARVVNVSAHSTRRQSPAIISYTAAKAATSSASKNLARSLAADGIIVNTVSPGSFMTPTLATYLERSGRDPTDAYGAYEQLMSEYEAACDLKRVGWPEEIGAVIAFLASKRNSYMTGADVNVDGGTDFF